MDLLPDPKKALFLSPLHPKLILAYTLVESVGHDSRLVATASLS